jgi:protein gp37
MGVWNVQQVARLRCTKLFPPPKRVGSSSGSNGITRPSTEAGTSEDYWKEPRRWNRAADKWALAHGRRRRVFCASLADVFDNQVPESWRTDLFHLIYETSQLDWQLLTKRPQNADGMLPPDWGDGYPNVWLGATTENREEYD